VSSPDLYRATNLKESFIETQVFTEVSAQCIVAFKVQTTRDHSLKICGRTNDMKRAGSQGEEKAEAFQHMALKELCLQAAAP